MNTTPETVNADRRSMNGKPVYTVPSKTVLNLDSGFKHKLLCDGPTFSTGTACAYSCAFCYVPDTMRKQTPWLHEHGVPDQPHEDLVIRRSNAVDILRAQLDAPKARALAERPLVIYASPLVDVAANMDLVRETVECCALILERTDWHIRLLSKSNLLPKVAQMLTELRMPRTRMIFGVSTGTLDDRLATAFEQGCPLVSKRLASLHWLQDHGFRTFGMICPSLPMTDGTKFAGLYRDFAARMSDAIRADRCEHIWAEVINVRGESMRRTVAALKQAGYELEASLLQRVSTDKAAWETYARQTFEAHAAIYARRPQDLRFLQYVNSSTRAWWASQQSRGAILL